MDLKCKHTHIRHKVISNELKWWNGAECLRYGDFTTKSKLRKTHVEFAFGWVLADC